MTSKKLFTALMLSSALSLMGCGETADTSAANTPTPSTKEVQKMISYDTPGQTDADHLWLEEVEGEKALAKVNAWNAASAKVMETELYAAMKSELLEVYNSPEKIPYISYRAGKAHNFWRDEKNVKGLWRMTTLESYQSETPEWETVLDIDALAKTDGKKWVYKGNDCLSPDYTRCIVSLSDGGKDAVERREFDITTKSFVEDGFVLGESKGATTWLDKDHLIVGSDFGPGTMTDSGYPRIVKLWKRGTPLESAKILYEGQKTDIGDWGFTIDTLEGTKEIVIQKSLTFFEKEYYWMPQSGDKAFELVKIPVPTKSSLAGEYKGQQLLTLQVDWRGFKSGALVSFALSDFMKDGKIDTITEVLTPNSKQSIENFGVTKSGILISLFENVTGSARIYDFDDTSWSHTPLDFPKNGNVSIGATNSDEDVAFVSTESFLEPDSLWIVNAKEKSKTKINSLPHWFDSEKMVSEQHFSVSSDGTKIPYFIIHQKDIPLDGSNPTLLYGYGGFRISLNPSYSATIGRAWLERGGVYVVANTRGGEEYGPAWHQAGLKEKRQLIYDDFISVAEDLIDRKITTPDHLGIHGRSNGGLLMGVMFTQRPELFNAVAVGVPLLDMQRYDKLLAGASWVGEYGDPNDKNEDGTYSEEAKFIRKLSPYHQIKAGTEYPVPYIYTSTKDDRVHPGHARKFAQRLEDMGYPFMYYENIDGGHAGASNLEETAHSYALIYSYFASQLMD